MRDSKLIIEDNSIKIYIDDLLHINLRHSEFIGIQSWIEGNQSVKYCIEYYTRTTSVLTQFDKEEKWKAILTLLDHKDLHRDFTHF